MIVGVIGSGAIGPDLAYGFVSALASVPGAKVYLHDIKQEALDAGVARIKGYVKKGLSRGKIAPKVAAGIEKALKPTLELGDLADCDYVLEAATEDLPIKRVILRGLEDVVRPDCLIGFATSGLPRAQIASEATHPDRPAIDALTDYLGQGRTSMLYKNLVKEKKAALNVGAFGGFPGDKYSSMVAVYAMAAAEHDNEELETEIFAEVDRLKNELIPAEEVEKIKARAKAQFINGMDDNQGVAMQLAAYQTRWGNWREMFRELDRINAVTAEDIQRVAQEYLIKKNRTVGMLNHEEI